MPLGFEKLTPEKYSLFLPLLRLQQEFEIISRFSFQDSRERKEYIYFNSSLNPRVRMY